MTEKPTLAIANPTLKPSDWKPTEPSWLDKALAGAYLLDVLIILISPDASVEGGFHLSIKSRLRGETQPLWLNVFGPKEYLAASACAALEAVLDGQPPQRQSELQRWQGVLADYSWSRATYLMLPE